MTMADGASTYRLQHSVSAGTALEVDVDADKRFSVMFDPGVMTRF